MLHSEMLVHNGLLIAKPFLLARLRRGLTMILLKAETLRGYLKQIHRNQTWLAHQLGVSKGYISQVMHNQSRMYLPTIERLLILTHIRFEDLFILDKRKDSREFYGGEVWYENKMNKRKDYEKLLEQKVFGGKK